MTIPKILKVQCAGFSGTPLLWCSGNRFIKHCIVNTKMAPTQPDESCSPGTQIQINQFTQPQGTFYKCKPPWIKKNHNRKSLLCLMELICHLQCPANSFTDLIFPIEHLKINSEPQGITLAESTTSGHWANLEARHLI